MQSHPLSQPFAPCDVSIFVSSTFRDMHEERDALRDVVLPRLREELGPWTISADLVDLRWGVDTLSTPEADHDAKVLKVCFSEIERCDPFFIALLGDRYGYVPDGEDLSVTEQEIERALSLPQMRNRMICCFRTIENRDELTPALCAEFLDPEHEEDMAVLRAKLRAKGVGAVVDYAVRVTPDGKYDLGTFTDAVTKALISQVRAELGELPAEIGALDRERARTARLVRELSDSFVGRASVVASWLDLCSRDEPSLTVVLASPGGGKTSTVARVATLLQESGREVVCILCGQGSETSDVPGVLRFLIHSLDPKAADKSQLSAMSRDQLVAQLSSLVWARRQDRPLTILIDAVDQLVGDDGASLSWLPPSLPPRCHVICTGVPLSSDETGGYGRREAKRLSLPPLGSEDARDIAISICSRRHRELSDAAIDALLDKASDGREGATPLYLRLVVQYLLMLRRDDFRDADRIAEERGLTPGGALDAFLRDKVAQLPKSIEGMYDLLIQEAALRAGLPTSDGLPQAVLALAASRRGLRMEDLSRALGASFDAASFALLRQMLPEEFVQRGRMEWDFSHYSFRRMAWLLHGDDVLAVNRKVVSSMLSRFEQSQPGADDKFVEDEVMHHLHLSGDAHFAASLVGRYAHSGSTALLPGLASTCSTEAPQSADEDFLVKMARSMSGRSAVSWYWYSMAFDRGALFSVPEAAGISLARRVWVFETMIQRLDLVRDDEDLLEWMLAHAYGELALTHSEAGRRDLCERCLNEALSHLAKCDSKLVLKRMGTSISLAVRYEISLGNLLLEQRRPQEALEHYKRYVSAARGEWEAAPQNARDRWAADLVAGYASVINLVGNGSGGPAAAAPYAQEALEVIDTINADRLPPAGLMNAQSALALSSWSLKATNQTKDASRCAMGAMWYLLRIHQCIPNLDADRLLGLLVPTLSAGESLISLSERGNAGLARIYEAARPAIIAGHKKVRGKLLRTLVAVLGSMDASEKLIDMAYEDDRGAAAGIADAGARQTWLDMVDFGFVLEEEAHARYVRSDRVLPRVAQELIERIRRSDGSSDEDVRRWRGCLAAAQGIQGSRSGLFQLGELGDAAADPKTLQVSDLLSRQRLTHTLASSYAYLQPYYQPIGGMTFRLWKRSYELSRELGDRDVWGQPDARVRACCRYAELVAASLGRTSPFAAVDVLLHGMKVALSTRDDDLREQLVALVRQCMNRILSPELRGKLAGML